ncbi:hypothetical protein JHK85_009617 [Glycine max]|nr:hypothetical protein JHK85_009617 [Glycine max]KAG5065628.1 hypothetical protein JHK86_009359 [Glycine max]
MNPSTESDNAIIIDIDSSVKTPSFVENHPNEEKHQLNVPFLLQPSYATHELRNLRTSLKWCALDHSSLVGKLISYVVFIFLTVAVPLFTSLFVHVPASASQLYPFNFKKLLQLPQSALAIIAFFTLYRFFPRTGLFLLACVLFRLNCELQILRFEGLHKLFERCGSDANMTFREHVRIRRQLWITSHGYRFFIISCLVTVTVSQLGSLLMVLESKSDTTFFNSGDLVVKLLLHFDRFCSFYFFRLCNYVDSSLCLMGAARITHRAQGIVSIATKWHMVVTNASVESEQWKTQMPEGVPSPAASRDSDSSDICISVTPQRPSSFQTRQALVTYLQHNYGGTTLFGFVLDRGLLHTLFAFEFSMVLWILSMVAVWS